MPIARLSSHMKHDRTKMAIVSFIFAVQILLFMLSSLFRFVDGDEGYYILASKLVSSGKVPYLDFFYTQMPFLPYVYGLWIKMFGISWHSARVLSALFSIATGIIIYVFLEKALQHTYAAIAAVVLYTASTWAFGWYTVVKTYALSTFLLFSAYVILYYPQNLSNRLRFLSSGILVGLAINTRLIFFSAVPAFLLAVYQDREPRRNRREVLFSLLAGIAIAMIPNLYFIAMDGPAFWFGNIGYHRIRSSSSWLLNLQHTVAILLRLLGILTIRGIESFQFKILLFLNTCYIITHGIHNRKIGNSLWIAGFLAIGHLVPQPVHDQYFAVLLPFLVIGAGYTTGEYLRCLIEPNGPRQLSGARTLGTIALISFLAYILVSPVDLYRYLVSGQDVPGILDKADRDNWRIATIREISREINKRNPHRRPVVALWPGYMVESDSEILPGLENHFGLLVSNQLDPYERKAYHIVSSKDIVDHLEENQGLVVLGNCRESPFPTRSFLLANNYTLVKSISDAELYVKQE